MQSCRNIGKGLSKSCNDTLGINWYPGHKKQLGMGVQAKHVSLLPSWLLLRSSFASNSLLFAFENRKKHARTPLDGENGGKTKASTQKQLCFPSPCFLLELHEGGISGSVKSDQRHSALGPCGACGALQSRIGHGSNSQKYEKPPPIHFQLHTATKG